jgi:hypothetical protein
MMCRRVQFALLTILSLLVLPVQADFPLVTGPASLLAPIFPAGVPDSGIGMGGQSIITVIATFLAVVILGFIVIARREHIKVRHRPLRFWLETIAGLLYLGGSAVVLVHLVREISTVAISPLIPFTLLYALIPAALGMWAMRIARCPVPGSLRERVFLVLIGLLGILFWSGFIIGPVIALCAAIVPIHWEVPSLPGLPKK